MPAVVCERIKDRWPSAWRRRPFARWASCCWCDYTRSRPDSVNFALEEKATSGWPFWSDGKVVVAATVATGRSFSLAAFDLLEQVQQQIKVSLADRPRFRQPSWPWPRIFAPFSWILYFYFTLARFRSLPPLHPKTWATRPADPPWLDASCSASEATFSFDKNGRARSIVCALSSRFNLIRKSRVSARKVDRKMLSDVHRPISLMWISSQMWIVIDSGWEARWNQRHTRRQKTELIRGPALTVLGRRERKKSNVMITVFSLAVVVATHVQMGGMTR